MARCKSTILSCATINLIWYLPTNMKLKTKSSKLVGLLLLLTVVLLMSVSPVQSFFDEDPGDKEVVVLLHGLARSNAAMWVLNLRLQKAGFHVEQIGYSSLNSTPQQIIVNVTSQINECCRDLGNRVHFVGHSLGGLLIRAYLQDNRVNNLGRVVLLGTPNQGTALADYFSDKWWAQFAGPTAMSLGTDENSLPNSLAAPNYPVGVIAGVIKNDMNDKLLPGMDDGLVSIEATKLPGMQDFIVISTGHAMMRYNEEVAEQTVRFLRKGKFARGNNK